MPNTHGPIQDEVYIEMNVLGGVLDEVFNGKNQKGKSRKFGFALLVFPFGEDDGTHRMNYISNSKRKDMIKAMKEFISKEERNT